MLRRGVAQGVDGAESRRRVRAALDDDLSGGAVPWPGLCSAGFYPWNISVRRHGSLSEVLHGNPRARSASGQPKRLLYQASQYEVLRGLRDPAGFQTVLA